MRRELRWRRRGLYRLFFGLVFLPMLCVFPYLRAVNNPNEFTRVYTVMALVESRTFRIDEQVQTWGWVNDMARVQGKSDGLHHYYMVKAPGIVYAGVPGYFLFSKVIAPLLHKTYPGIWKGHSAPLPNVNYSPASEDDRLWWLRMATWSMRIFGSQIPCFLFLLWLEKYLRFFCRDPALRWAAVAAAGLGTNYLAYTHMFASHSQYAAVAFLAFATIEKELRRSRGDILKMRPSRAFLAGFFTSACVALEYHALFMTIVMSLFAALTFWSPLRFVFATLARIPPLASLRRWVPLGSSFTPTRLLAFALGGLVNVPHVMYFHWTAYNNPFTPGHQMLETAHFAAEHQMGLWGVMWPTWEHIKALAIDPGFGFFGMSPFMWLGLVGAAPLLLAPRGPSAERMHVRVVTVVWLACMAVVIGVNAGFVEWRAGWTVGPRYLVVCAPFFAFGAAFALERFAYGSHLRRVVARGIAGGLALASVLTIGTVGIIYDTLPETIARPFAQFSIPMARVGMLPHHVAEWVGWTSTTFWYVVCAAMLLAPSVVGLWPSPGERGLATIGARTAAFVVALAVGMIPAFSTPEDGTPLFVLHPSTVGLTAGWEPPGRDRISLLREEAERLGSRGHGPCLWYRIADLERVLNLSAQAARDESRARSVPRERCPRTYF